MLNTFFAVLKQRIVDRFTPNVSTILGEIAKIEAKIEQAIDKSGRQLANLHAAEAAIVDAKYAMNAEMNASYKLLHNISSMLR